ncbi:MAG: TonB-dependent receptor plug domain-containing protein [Flavobacteriales bacterium]
MVKRKLLILTTVISFMGLLKSQKIVINDVDSLTTKTFRLGEVNLIASQRDEITGRISTKDMENQNRFEVSRSVNMLPGVSLSSSGSRNESTVSVRGFDLRAVPVYMDGIPVYVPYDGYVDLGRFTTFDLAAIDVSKGFSSMLYGPNSLGGAINLISRKPVEKLEYDGSFGIINANGYRSNINIGSNWGNFFVQGGYSYLYRASYTLSDKFVPHAYEDGGERENSYRTDQKINLKIGWTPNENQEYVLGYINQQGEKGSPVYAGEDESNSLSKRPRYWQWPDWDKETYYFLSNTAWNDKNYIKTRFYYDRFKNSLYSFDDETYTTQDKSYAFQSRYNDYTYGGSLEYGTTIIPKNELKFSAHYKKDVHRENNLGEPVRNFEDNTFDFALENIYKLNDKLMIIPGVSYSSRKNVRAEDYDSSTNTVSDYDKGKASNTFNGQLGVFYQFKKNHKVGITASRKTRFATIKDRYSYRMGRAVPNPDLKPETSDNYDLTYSGKFFKKLSFQTSLFYSHLTDAIISVSNVQPGKSQMQNAGLAEFKGVEVAAQYNIRHNLLLGANYSYIERDNLADPEILFTDVPYTKVFSYVQYEPVKRMRIMVNMEYNSLRYSTDYGTKAPEFILVNTLISGQILKYMSVEAGVNNIFDKNYMLTEGYPEEGRNFFVTFRFFNH